MSYEDDHHYKPENPDVWYCAMCSEKYTDNMDFGARGEGERVCKDCLDNCVHSSRDDGYCLDCGLDVGEWLAAAAEHRYDSDHGK